HYFAHIGGRIDQQAGGKNHDPLFQGMCERKHRGIPQPESQDAGIQGIDQKTGSEGFQYIVNAQFIEVNGAGGRFKMDFFEEEEKDAQSNQEAASAVADQLLVFQQPRNPSRKYIAEDNQDNITQPDAGHKTESPFMTAGETLLDDGKNNRTHRQCKHNPKC